MPGNLDAPAIHTAILRAFDSGAYTATLQLTGSLQRYVAGIPVARNIASGEMTAGRKVAVSMFDPSNPADGVVFAVWT